MIEAYTLHTSKIDQPSLAVAEIRRQLAEITLRRNAVGILVCHYDYVEDGIVSALKQVLPFPIAGITTFYQATPLTSGLFELTITVLTSDDVRFALACSASEQASLPPRERIEAVYRSAFDRHKEPPALILSFISANRPITGDAYVRYLDEASGGVPNFGVVNSGEDESGANIFVIHEGDAFSDCFVMLLLIGDLEARMYVNGLPEQRLLALSMTVTASIGTTVSQLNGQPAGQYLRKNGLDLGDMRDEIVTSLPFYCRRPGDETFVGRLLCAIDSNDALEFMAEVPEGSLLRIGLVTAEDIRQESRSLMQLAVDENPRASLFLAASCVGRFITLGFDTSSELDHALGLIEPGDGFLASYVGGEICAIYQDGRWLNRYHNNSFIVLALH